MGDDETAVPPGAKPRQGRVERLLDRAETAVFWLAVAPLLALLPVRLAYRGACWRGDLTFWCLPGWRRAVVRGLRGVYGKELGARQAERVAREVFRTRSCQVIDLMLLRGRGRSLQKLVEIRGLEHLEAALADGNGALLCSPHLGSYMCAFSLLQAAGFRVTSIGRWWWRYRPGSSAGRRTWDWLYARRVLRYRQGPNIEPWPGRPQVALQAAAALRGNGVVTICSDAPPLDSERPRAVPVSLLGRPAMLLPGVVPLARLTGAPVLMTFVRRGADYRHQVLEISPPVPLDGETETAFGRCVAAMDAAITASPAEWDFWFEPDDLDHLGLLRGVPAPRPAAGAHRRTGRTGAREADVLAGR